MNTPEQFQKLSIYYATAILSLVIAVAGFSYNTWRMEVTEDNSNIRTASFEVFAHLAELEQVIYASHYDGDEVNGSPRKGWVKVGLIVDLSSLISPKVAQHTAMLKTKWSQNWQAVPDNQEVVDALISQIDTVRKEIKMVLADLQ